MKKTDTWMPLYVGDYMADTARLTTEQHGAYLLLMLDYWRKGPPPDSDEVLATITKLSVAAWRKHRPALEGFFRIEEGYWYQGRIDRERDRARAVSGKRSEAGKAGAAVKHGKQPGKSVANATANAEANAQQNPGPSQSQLQEAKDKTVALPRSLTLGDLVSTGVTEAVAVEFMSMRKRKRAPLTERAWAGIEREIRKAGWSVQDALEKCLARGWQGFEADWVRGEKPQKTVITSQPNDAERYSWAGVKS